MKRALIIVLIAAPFLLAMSYPGREAHSGPLYLFSALGWFGFLLATLTALVLTVTMVVRRAARRTPAAGRG
jgi:membrane-anchored protein YejM (alkaline phosphatase superfamily)